MSSGLFSEYKLQSKQYKTNYSKSKPLSSLTNSVNTYFNSYQFQRSNDDYFNNVFKNSSTNTSRFLTENNGYISKFGQFNNYNSKTPKYTSSITEAQMRSFKQNKNDNAKLIQSNIQNLFDRQNQNTEFDKKLFQANNKLNAFSPLKQFNINKQNQNQNDLITFKKTKLDLGNNKNKNVFNSQFQQQCRSQNQVGLSQFKIQDIRLQIEKNYKQAKGQVTSAYVDELVKLKNLIETIRR